MVNQLVLLGVLGSLYGFNFAYAGFTTTKISPQPIWNSTHIDRLRKDLLLNYDKFARPTQHFNVTRVSFDITIKHLDINESKSSLTVLSWLRLKWKDEKLKWNSTNYGGIEMIHLAEHEIWQPDIFLYNSGTSTALAHYGNVHCLAWWTGHVLWVPPAHFTVLCNLNLKYWPFDTQVCNLTFGSWTHAGDEIDLEILDNHVEAQMDLLIEGTEWTIVKTSLTKHTVYYACCTSPYPDVTVEIVLSRISPSYKTLIVTPAFVIIVLILVSFWLPPQAGEKLALNGCSAIIICLFMLYFSQKLPAMSTHTPLIVLFYSSCLYIVSFSMIASIIAIGISRTPHINALPWVIKQPLTGTFGKLLGLSSYIQQPSSTPHNATAEEMRDHQVTDFEEINDRDEHHIIKPPTKPSTQYDWILLAMAVDRLSFFSFCFLFIILTIVYSV